MAAPPGREQEPARQSDDTDTGAPAVGIEENPMESLGQTDDIDASPARRTAHVSLPPISHPPPLPRPHAPNSFKHNRVLRPHTQELDQRPVAVELALNKGASIRATAEPEPSQEQPAQTVAEQIVASGNDQALESACDEVTVRAQSAEPITEQATTPVEEHPAAVIIEQASQPISEPTAALDLVAPSVPDDAVSASLTEEHVIKKSEELKQVSEKEGGLPTRQEWPPPMPARVLADTPHMPAASMPSGSGLRAVQALQQLQGNEDEHEPGVPLLKALPKERRHLLLGVSMAEIEQFINDIKFDVYERKQDCWINVKMPDCPKGSGYDFIAALTDWMETSGIDNTHTVFNHDIRQEESRTKIKMQQHSLWNGYKMTFKPASLTHVPQTVSVGRVIDENEFELRENLAPGAGELQAKDLRSVAEWISRKKFQKSRNATWFVSHVQFETVEETLRSIRFKHAEDRERRYWFDYFTLRQGQQRDSEFRLSEIKQVISKDMDGMLVIVDKEAKYFQRLFCLFELCSVEAEKIDMAGGLKHLDDLDVSKAECRCPKATAAITKDIKAEYGCFDKFAEQIIETGKLNNVVIHARSMKLLLNVEPPNSDDSMQPDDKLMCEVIGEVISWAATETGLEKSVRKHDFNVVVQERDRTQLTLLATPSPGSITSLQQLRNEVMSRNFDTELEKALNQRNCSFKHKFKVDLASFLDYFDEHYLAIEELTEHQKQKLDECLATDKNIHIKAPAGAGKTFVALRIILEVLRNDLQLLDEFVVFAVPALGLAYFIIRWIRSRIRNANDLNWILQRLRFITLDTRSRSAGSFMPLVKDVRWYKGELEGVMFKLQECDKVSTSEFRLLVIDEAHVVCECEGVVTLLDECKKSSVQVICLSDEAQSREKDFAPESDFELVKLSEVIRCTQRIVAGAMTFQVGAQKALTSSLLKDKEPGPPLFADIFEMTGTNHMQEYAEHTADALQMLIVDYRGLSLHKRVAVLVPSCDFKERYVQALKTTLENRPDLKCCHIEDACDSLSGVKETTDTWSLICDSVDEFDGLERTFVALVGLDQQISDQKDAKLSVTRSMLYRGMTRAQYKVMVINEFLEGGWFQFLTRVEMEKEGQQVVEQGSVVDDKLEMKQKHPFTMPEIGPALKISIQGHDAGRAVDAIMMTHDDQLPGKVVGAMMTQEDQQPAGKVVGSMMTQEDQPISGKVVGTMVAQEDQLHDQRVPNKRSEYQKPKQVKQSIWQTSLKCKQTDHTPAFNPFPSAVDKFRLGGKQNIIEAVSEDGSLLEFAQDEMKSDKEIVLAAVNQMGRALQYATDTLKADWEVVMAAVTQDGAALKYAADHLRADKEIVLVAVAQCGPALKFAEGGLNQDAECVKAAGLLEEDDGDQQKYKAMQKVNGKVFISYRMAETKKEAKELQAALEPCTTKTMRVNESPGADLLEVIVAGIDEADLIVIIGSKTYGEKTSGVIDTYMEMRHIQNEGKEYFLIKACDDFAHAATRMIFSFKTQAYTEWLPGTPMPPDMVENILNKLRTIKGESNAAPAASSLAGPAPTQAPAPESNPTPAAHEPEQSQPVINMADYDTCPGCGGDAGDGYMGFCSSRCRKGYGNGVCMHGDCLVVMANGGGLKPLRSLVRGDLVQTDGGAVTSVRCVVEFPCREGQTWLCKFSSGLLITPWHPIRDAGVWRFPWDLVKPCLVPCDSVWNLVLEECHVVTIHDTECVTLGHGFEDPIVNHAYFGTPRVIEDLGKMYGWRQGHVNLGAGCVMRDDSGLVCGLKQVRNE